MEIGQKYVTGVTPGGILLLPEEEPCWRVNARLESAGKQSALHYVLWGG